jgi:hypothetical protein
MERITIMTTPSKRITRRNFLRAGVASLVLVSGGLVYRATDRGVFTPLQGPAYEPWQNWREPQAGPLNLVRAAILASNPHNIQPWLFRVTDTQIDVYVDTTRNIGAVDPFFRELWIGVGAALENMSLAAAAEGYAATITLVPDDEPNHAARIDLAPGQAASSPLYEAIPLRRTNRTGYDTSRPIDPGVFAAFEALNDQAPLSIVWVSESGERQRFADAMLAATDAFNADEQQLYDSESKFRQAGPAIQQFRDGITLDAQVGPTFQSAFVKMLPDIAPGDGASSFRNLTSTHVSTAAAFGIMTAENVRDNQQRLLGGRLWQRMHLWATTQGVAMQPLSQLTERTDRELQRKLQPQFGDILRTFVNDTTRQALFCFRIGYPLSDGGLSPRRALEEVLI